VPGAANLSAEELQAISQTSNNVLKEIGKPYTWVQSYVAGDKLYCVHIAPDEETVREHARLGGFPVNSVTEVQAIIDPSTGGQ
jgi:hypothetical protein